MPNRLFVTLGAILILCLSSHCTAIDVDSLLHWHLEQVGGRQVVSAVTSESAYLAVDYMGMKGTVEMHFSFPYRYYMHIDLGMITSTLGCDGVTGWKVGEDGLVSTMSEAELLPIVNALFVSTYSYVLPNRIPGDVRYIESIDMAGTEHHILGCYPDAGDSIKIYINGETGLITSNSNIETGVEMISTVLEYREVDGIKIPWEDAMIGLNSPIKAWQRADSVFFNRSIPDSLFDMPGKSSIDYEFAGGAATVEIPLEIANDHIFLKARVNGKGPFTFLLDSGAGKSVLSRVIANELELNSSGEIASKGIGGFGSVTIGEIDSISLGDLTLSLDRIMITDLSQFRNFQVGAVQGIIGYDFFVRFPMVIDFESENMILVNPSREFRPEFENLIDAELYFQIPTIEAQLNGVTGRFLFDLGAQSGVLLYGGSALQESLIQDLGAGSDKFSILGIGGETEVSKTTLDSLRIGDVRIDDPEVIWSENPEEMPFPGYLEGIIGTRILSGFRLYIDYERGKIGLDKVN